MPQRQMVVERLSIKELKSDNAWRVQPVASGTPEKRARKRDLDKPVRSDISVTDIITRIIAQVAQSASIWIKIIVILSKRNL